MNRLARWAFGRGLCLAFIVAAQAAWGAEAADEQPRERVVWGEVVAATDRSVTVQPKLPARRPSRRANAARPAPPKPQTPKPQTLPAQQVIPLAQDQTEVAFAEVQREMPMADGTALRTFADPVPAAMSDIKPGRLVQVTVRDGVADQVLIAWGERGTVVRVEGDSIIFRPQTPDEQQPAKQDDAAGQRDHPEQQVKASDEMTTVRIVVITGEGSTPAGGFQQSYEYKPAKLADLKAGDNVVLCAKDGTAAKITVLPAAAKP